MTTGITHKEALAALSDADLGALKARSDGPALKHIAGHLGLLVATGILVQSFWGSWIIAPVLVLHGVIIVFLFAPLHETIHETAFSTRSLNVAVARFCGFVLLLPPRYFRYFHFAHHRYTQDAGRDPELKTPRPGDWGSYLRALTGIEYWRGQIAALVQCAAGRTVPDFVPARGRDRVRAEARWFLAGYAFLAAGSIAVNSSLLLWLWIVPAVLGQPFLRAYLLAEHTGCPLVPDMLINSRTTFTNRLVLWIAWNMPNHAAHHALPTVPFDKLPRLTALLRQNLKTTASGYVDAHRQIVHGWTGGPDNAAPADREAS